MKRVLVATATGCLLFSESGEAATELQGRPVYVLAPDGGGCLAIVAGQEIHRRDANGSWSLVATSKDLLASVLSEGGSFLGGGMSAPILLRFSPDGSTQQLTGLDETPGRQDWFQQGPPLCVRALSRTVDQSVILAAIHVGGIPRSEDGGKSWIPTLAVDRDVHDVGAHPSKVQLVAAATAFGLCVSYDRGLTWQFVTAGLEFSESLAVGLLEDVVLYSIQDGPFASKSQVWRWRIDGELRAEPVREGLPEWFEGKVDTGYISVSGSCAAILDGGGNLWVSPEGARNWTCRARALKDAYGVLVLP